MSETKKYIDLNYLQSFWTFIKGIPTSVKYTLNNKSQTIKDAIDDLGTNKQDKLEPGFGIEIQDDTILAEVKYIHQDEEWKVQTWSGYTSIYGPNIWTDNNGTIHFDYGSNHYQLASDGITWTQQTWSGYTGSIYGSCIWKDNNGVIHFDYDSYHYQLAPDGITWIQQTWNGYTGSIFGYCIWKDNNGVIHFDNGSNHYQLASDGITWTQQAWNGYTSINGDNIWTDYNGVIHYDRRSDHYQLASDGITWTEQTWNGYDSFSGSCIWTDNNGVIHFDDGSNHYYLAPDGITWTEQTWNGYESIDGDYIWKDNNGVIHFDTSSNHYYLQEGKNQYLTRHNDELQTKITAGEGVTIKNGVISATVKNQDLSGYATESWVESKGYLTEHQSLTEYAKKSELPVVPTNVSAFTNDAGYLTEHQDISTKQDVLTPGFGIEIQNDNTIDAEVEYENVENHFEESTLEVPNNGYGNHIFYTKNGTIYYMYHGTFCYLDRLSNTWVELDATTCPGNGQETWMDYDGTIRLKKYKLNENTNTWSLDSNEQVSIGYGHTVYMDYNGILRSSNAGVARTRNISTLQWEIDADQTGPFNSYGTWFDYNGIIHCGAYLLNKSTGLWESDSSGIGKSDGSAIEDNNGILHYFYGQTHQILDKETNTWVDEPLEGVLATDRFYSNQFWTDYQGNLHFGKYLFITKNRGYITRHNDRLQLKLIPGNGVNIDQSNVISVIGGDLSNYYNKTEVDNKISAIPKFSISVVSTLPTTNISSTTVYLVANTTTQTQNLYTEYIYVNSKWEKLGEQTIDLSGYATTTALNAKQDSLTTAQLSAVNSGITSTKVSTYDGYANSIANKVDKASGKGLSTNDYTTAEKNKLAGIAENANNYSHPTYTSKTSGLYKITVDGTGHVSGTAVVTASDLPSHSHTGYLTSETDPVFSASAAAGITSADITNWNGKTSNTGTVTQVKIGSTAYNPTSGVISLPAYPTVSYPVSSVAGKTGAVTLSSSDVGLGNVGNFKAVSTVASQGLTDTEKSNARANIGAGTSSLTLGTTSTTAAAGNHTHSGYAIKKTLTNENLNNVTTPGFYDAGGDNACTNTQTAGRAFGLTVTHNATGNYYTQILYDYQGKHYYRNNINGTWGSWTEIKYTDTNTDRTTVTVGTTNITQTSGTTHAGITLVAGSNVTLTPNTTDKSVTIASTNTDTKVEQSVSTSTNWKSILTGNNELSTSGATATTATNKAYMATGVCVQPSTGTIHAKSLILDPGTNNNYTEGVRVNAASDGWAILNLGGAANSLNGAATDGWIIGRRGDNHSGSGVFAPTGSLYFGAGGSNTSNGITMSTAGSLATSGMVIAKSGIRVGGTHTATTVTGGCVQTYNANTQCLEFTF